jgi:hypothetical protein
MDMVTLFCHHIEAIPPESVNMEGGTCNEPISAEEYQYTWSRLCRQQLCVVYSQEMELCKRGTS